MFRTLTSEFDRGWQGLLVGDEIGRQCRTPYLVMRTVVPG